MTVYAAAPLCAEAERVLARQGERAGSVRVTVTCLPRVESGERIDLAQIGANARRATEDSATVAYIGEATPAATRFSAPILESAAIPQLSNFSGEAAMSKLLKAIDEVPDGGSLRESLTDQLP